VEKPDLNVHIINADIELSWSEWMLVCWSSLLFFWIAVVSTVTLLGQWCRRQWRPRSRPATARDVPLRLGKRADQASDVVRYKWNEFRRRWHTDNSITISAFRWTSVSDCKLRIFSHVAWPDWPCEYPLTFFFFLLSVINWSCFCWL